jgi:hypothetical protein
MKISGKKSIVVHMDTGAVVYEGSYEECHAYAVGTVNVLASYAIFTTQNIVSLLPQPAKIHCMFTGERAQPAKRGRR